MTNPVEPTTATHTLHLFEGELQHLHQLKIEMARLVVFQLQQAMLALNDGDMELAELVVLRDQAIKQLEIQVDAEVLNVLARQCPVANDLRTVISTSKIAAELEKIGAEILDFAHLVAVLFNPNTSDPNPQLLVDIVKISQLVDNALQVMLLLLETENPQLAYLLLTEGQECHIELQEGIKHQLSFVVQDARMIGRALDIMQIMKALEGCVEFCHNIAEYMIFKIEGINIRHSDSFATMP